LFFSNYLTLANNLRLERLEETIAIACGLLHFKALFRKHYDGGDNIEVITDKSVSSIVLAKITKDKWQPVFLSSVEA
jgi:hypothetical protein